MRRTLISLADVLNCQHELLTRGAASQLMLRMLGHESLISAPSKNAFTEPQPRQRSDGAHQPSALESSQERPLPISEAPAPQAAEAAGQAARASAAAAALAFWLRPLPRTPSASASSVASPPLPPASAASAPPSPLPLFATPRHRAILVAMASTFVAEGPLDMPRIVAAAVQRRPLRTLPRQGRPTVRRGLQLLIDRSPSLVPFARDVDMLIPQMQTLLGKSQIEVCEFTTFPLATPYFEGDQLGAPWRSPRSGASIVIVSDFGIGARADQYQWVPLSEWRRFARLVKGLGCVLFGLVPYHAARWPMALTSAITCIHWSERTTVGAVSLALRRRQQGLR